MTIADAWAILAVTGPLVVLILGLVWIYGRE